jgi:hypothetical protein
MLITMLSCSIEKNKGYRADFMEILSSRFEVRHKELRGIYAIIFNAIFSSETLITSDGKVNLLTALFSKSRQLMILNGLGVFERNRIVRCLLILAINRKTKIKVAVQNYRDFRYLSRFVSKIDKIVWIPGSGGKLRNASGEEKTFMISRQKKFRRVLSKLSKVPDKCKPIYVLGDVESVARDDVRILGSVEQDEIFSVGNNFLQLDGYGEGVPHTLCDAICTGLKVTIEKSCFIKYGLYRFPYKHFQSLNNGEFYILDEHPESVKNTLHSDSVNKMYLKALSDII